MLPKWILLIPAPRKWEDQEFRSFLAMLVIWGHPGLHKTTFEKSNVKIKKKKGREQASMLTIQYYWCNLQNLGRIFSLHMKTSWKLLSSLGSDTGKKELILTSEYLIFHSPLAKKTNSLNSSKDLQILFTSSYLPP